MGINENMINVIMKTTRVVTETTILQVLRKTHWMLQEKDHHLATKTLFVKLE
jgi:hypothetical protein